MKKIVSILLVSMLLLTACTQPGSKGTVVESGTHDRIGQIIDDARHESDDAEINTGDVGFGGDDNFFVDSEWNGPEDIPVYDYETIIDELLEEMNSGQHYIVEGRTVVDGHIYYVSFVDTGDIVFEFDDYVDSQKIIRELSGVEVRLDFTVYDSYEMRDRALVCTIPGVSFLGEDEVDVDQLVYAYQIAGRDYIGCMTVETKTQEEDKNVDVFGALIGMVARNVLGGE